MSGREYGILNAECGIRNAEFGIEDKNEKCGVEDACSSIPHSEFRIPNSEFINDDLMTKTQPR